MFQHAFYSVISPEGCAAILWKTAEKRKHAAEALRITARELHKLDIIDDIIPEPIGGAHRDPESAAASLERYFVHALDELKPVALDVLLRKRQDRIRDWGSFFESPSERIAPTAIEEVHMRRSRSRVARLSTRVPAAAVLAD
jgi:acetyl-CoA carboxylase carboxyl transferase subunit alpha